MRYFVGLVMLCNLPAIADTPTEQWVRCEDFTPPMFDALAKPLPPGHSPSV